MTDDIGWSELEVRAALSRSFKSDLDRGVTSASTAAGDHAGGAMGTRMGQRVSTTMHDKIRESAKYIVGPLIGAFAVEKIGDLVRDSIEGAVEDAAATNRVKLIFGPMSEEVNKFSDNAAKSYGLADDAARSAAAGFGILFKGAHLSREENAKASIQMVKLAADLAAFGHTDFQSAYQALNKGVAGSTRGLKNYGVIIDENMQKAEALRLGLLKPVKDSAKIHAAQVAILKDQAAYNDAVAKNGKVSLAAQEAHARLGTAQKALQTAIDGTVPPLTAEQKLLASRSLILSQTKTQQGQFARSSDDLAQQQDILNASWDNAKDRLGEGLLPMVTDLVHAINRDVIPAVDDASEWFEHKGAKAIQHYIASWKPLAESVLPAVKTTVGDVVGEVKDLAPVVKGIFDAFNKLPAPLQKAVVIGATAGYVGKKTGLLGAGVKALTGSGEGRSVEGALLTRGASPANPLYVVDINGGLGGVPGEGGKKPGVIPVNPKGAAGAAETAGAEAKAIEAAKAAAAATRAAGGTAAAESTAAARAFKEAMAAHDAAVLKDALSFSVKGGGRGLLSGLFRTVLAAPAGVTLGAQGAEHPDISGRGLQLTGKDFLASVRAGRISAAQTTDPSVLALYGLTQGQAHDLLHLKATTGAVDSLRASLGRESRALDLVNRSGQAQGKTFEDLVKKGSSYGTALSKLPKNVQTAILAPGLVQTQGDVDRLIRKYDLTPKQVTTLYRLEGLDKARADFDALQAHMGRHTTLTQQLDLATHRTPPSPRSGSGGGSGGGSGRRPVRLVLDDGRELGAYVDDRMDARRSLGR